MHTASNFTFTFTFTSPATAITGKPCVYLLITAASQQQFEISFHLIYIRRTSLQKVKTAIQIKAHVPPYDVIRNSEKSDGYSAEQKVFDTLRYSNFFLTDKQIPTIVVRQASVIITLTDKVNGRKGTP